MKPEPNAVLLLVLKPDGPPVETLRAILADHGKDYDPDDFNSIFIGHARYMLKVMESGYEEGFQVRADEGDIIMLCMATYGFGERIEWERLVVLKEALEEWAATVCAKHDCAASLFITANNWWYPFY